LSVVVSAVVSGRFGTDALRQRTLQLRFRFQSRDHLPDQPILATRVQHFEALLL
jgi:hypothetical protein